MGQMDDGETSTWLAEHQGEYVKTVGYVWECGDDECRCTQANVEDIFRNKTDSRFIVRVGVWSGEFHTLGYDDDEPSAEQELAEYRRAMRESDPEREASIEWSVAAAPARTERRGQ